MIFTAHKWSCGKVMFSVMSVCSQGGFNGKPMMHWTSSWTPKHPWTWGLIVQGLSWPQPSWQVQNYRSTISGNIAASLTAKNNFCHDSSVFGIHELTWFVNCCDFQGKSSGLGLIIWFEYHQEIRKLWLTISWFSSTVSVNKCTWKNDNFRVDIS